MASDTAQLVVLRHGESDWNQKNLFTGWVDVDLTATGEAEGRRAGELLVENHILPDVVHTSMLRRAIRTSQIALDVADRHWIPVQRSWRLNERHYGALQGKDKAQVRAEYGDQQFMLWRRSYDTPPPVLADDDRYSQAHDLRYRDLLETLPRSECLKDVVARMLPYWFDSIVADLRLARTVLVAAHGNSIRALIKYMEQIDDADIVELNVPTGIPLYYELDPTTMRPTAAGRYLDPDAAKAAIEAVANQGKATPAQAAETAQETVQATVDDAVITTETR